MCRPDQSARTAQADLVDTLRRYIDMSRPARKPTLWTLRKVTTRISLSMPRRLTRTSTFRLLWIFNFRNHYSDLGRYITQSPSCWFSLGTVHMRISEKLWEEIVFAGKAVFSRFHSNGSFYGDHTTKGTTRAYTVHPYQVWSKSVE